jgi:mannose-6-phosphate isomerase-like protein (cupin superfamily)
MRRIIAALAVVALVSLAIAGAVASPRRVIGQEASPSPGMQAPVGITFQFIGYGKLPQNMEPQDAMSMFRILFKPGAGFPVDKTDPTTALVTVEKGTLTVTVDTDIVVLHGGAMTGQMTQQDFTAMPAGQQFTMTVGDSALFPAYSSGQVSNEGPDDLTILVAQLEPPGYSEATPGAMATPGS